MEAVSELTEASMGVLEAVMEVVLSSLLRCKLLRKGRNLYIVVSFAKVDGSFHTAMEACMEVVEASMEVVEASVGVRVRVKK